MSAGWFWQKEGLNGLADKIVRPGDAVFERLTKRINGGLNGLKERQEIYARALEVLQ